MEDLKIQSSPRPTRRIVAGKRQRPDGSKNCVKKVLRREISRAGNWAFNRSNSQEKFRNFHLQLIGTGYSYSSDIRDLRYDEEGVSEGMFDFFQAFFEAHPKYASNDFYATGESHAGHYVPAVTAWIHNANKKEGVHINLKYYDIRMECVGDLCYDFSNLEAFLNQESVRHALGVGDHKFVSCSPLVYEAMIVDWMRNLEAGIPVLLEDGSKLLVYPGEYDLICN